MILDSIERLSLYQSMHPRFKKAIQFIERAMREGLTEGTYEIEGKKVYAMVSVASGRGKKNSPLEAHKKYIDIQVVVSGDECIGWSLVSPKLRKSKAYSPHKDIMFFADTPHEWIAVRAGMAMILFPHDAHAPLAGKGMIKKIVVKVAV